MDGFEEDDIPSGLKGEQPSQSKKRSTFQPESQSQQLQCQ
jgi:hypothetical protein